MASALLLLLVVGQYVEVVLGVDQVAILGAHDGGRAARTAVRGALNWHEVLQKGLLLVHLLLSWVFARFFAWAPIPNEFHG